MEIKQIKDVDVESTDQLESIDFSFDESSMALMFKSFTDSLYSDKLGSIVREITSNAIDANVAAGVDNPVDIVLKDSVFSGQLELSIIDYGTGMSPDLIKDTYSKYFASTKRTTNEQIGGWGIGAKTPLSYAKSFNLTTNYEGIKYKYLVSRGEVAPEILLIGTSETTDVGSSVVIAIDHLDRYALQDAIINQLAYFDNINYHGFDSDNITNDYRIHYYNSFLIREEYTSSLEVALGKVRYPLNFVSLGVDDWTTFYKEIGLSELVRTTYSHYGLEPIPLALRFDVGDLDVTLSRESLEYTPKTKQAILQKIRQMAAELKTLLESQVSDVNSLEEVFDYLKTTPVTRSTNGTYLKLENGNHHSLSSINPSFGKVTFIGEKAPGTPYTTKDLGGLSDYIQYHACQVVNGKVLRNRKNTQIYFNNTDKMLETIESAYYLPSSLADKKAMYILNKGNGYDVNSGKINYFKKKGNAQGIPYDLFSAVQDHFIGKMMSISDIVIDKEWNAGYRGNSPKKKTGIRVYSHSLYQYTTVTLASLYNQFFIYGTSDHSDVLGKIARNSNLTVYSVPESYLYEVHQIPSGVYVEDFNDRFQKSLIRSLWMYIVGDFIYAGHNYHYLRDCSSHYRNLESALKEFARFNGTEHVLHKHILHYVEQNSIILEERPKLEIIESIPDITFTYNGIYYSVKDTVKIILSLRKQFDERFIPSISNVSKFLISNSKDE